MVTSGDGGSNKGSRSDFLIDITTSLDPYVRYLKWVAYGAGTVGIVLVLRGIHATDVFSAAKDIPKRFMKNEVRLKGRVQSIEIDGTLLINHQPVLSLKPKWLQRFYKNKPLPVELAFLAVSPLGRQWIRDNVVGKKVLFQPLGIQEKSDPWPDTVLASVYLRQLWRYPCVNEDLIKLGICTVSYDAGTQVAGMTTVQSDFLNKLIGLESRASKRETGMWKEHAKDSTTVVTKIKKFGGAVKSIVTLPWRGAVNTYRYFNNLINKTRNKT